MCLNITKRTGTITDKNRNWRFKNCNHNRNRPYKGADLEPPFKRIGTVNI